MQTISITSIHIPANRQRQEFNLDAMQELIESIKTIGLLHAPVLRQDGERLALVAGERRLKAIGEIFELGGSFTYNGQVFSNSVPFVTLGELGRLEAEEAELDENLKRKDLTWQEHAAALQRLHALRKEQAEVKDLPAHTIADTAKELLGRSDGYFQDSIRKELIVARNLDNPTIAKAKNVDEAFKLLKREESAEKNRELAAIMGRSLTAESHTLVNQDACTFARSLPPESVDVILTDPPYGMGADSFGDAGGKLTGIQHGYDDSYENWKTLMAEWCPLAYTVAKKEAHAYVFCDFDRFHELKSLMERAGWYVFRTPLIVYKLNSGRVPLPDSGPRRQYETLLYAIKGKKPVTHIYSDVIPSKADENMSHGAQKPVAVYQDLLLRSVRPGDTVADFFAGSGTIFPAAHSMQCIALGSELNPEYYGMCISRIKALQNATAQ